MMSRVTTDLPAGLAAALAQHGAAVERVASEGSRRYVSAGALFGRFTTAAGDEPSFAHEVAVRAIVGGSLPLRAPAIVASGPGWTLEQAVPRRPPAGEAAVRATIAAALAVADLDLPVAPPGAGGEGGGARWRRRARMAFGGVRPGDLLAARRAPELPLVASHGDFHAGNVLCGDDGPWVIDWELTARRPVGYDLLTLWPTLESEADRALVLDAALAQAGPDHRTGVLRLRFALLVRALAAVAGAPRGVGGVGPGERELRGLLARARRESA